MTVACSQALVNLLITGEAVANVWDGDRDAGGLSEMMKMHLAAAAVAAVVAVVAVVAVAVVAVAAAACLRTALCLCQSIYSPVYPPVFLSVCLSVLRQFGTHTHRCMRVFSLANWLFVCVPVCVCVRCCCSAAWCDAAVRDWISHAAGSPPTA